MGYAAVDLMRRQNSSAVASVIKGTYQKTKQEFELQQMRN